MQFDTDGAFKLQGDGWPTFVGNWKADGETLEVNRRLAADNAALAAEIAVAYAAGA